MVQPYLIDPAVKEKIYTCISLSKHITLILGKMSEGNNHVTNTILINREIKAVLNILKSICTRQE